MCVSSPLFWIRILLGLVLLTGAANAQDRAAGVLVDTVRTEEVLTTKPVVGRFVAAQAGTVAAREAGPVAEVPVRVGDRVAEGEVLVRLDDAALEAGANLAQAQVTQARAGLTQARARLNRARQELGRLARLRRSAAFSQGKYEDKQQDVAEAEASVHDAEANLQRAQAAAVIAALALERAEVRAPYDGVITHKATEVGAYVTKGASLVTLVNDRDLEMEAEVPAILAADLHADDTVAVFRNGRPLTEATVRAVVPEENPRTRTRVVRLTPRLESLSPAPTVGESVTLMVPAGGQTKALTLSKDAVTFQQGQAMVFVNQDGTAMPRPVTLGPATGGRFQVIHGLAPGDQVVVRGNERLRPGQPIAPTPVDQAASQAAAATKD